jgi:hypothetical protein
MWNINANSQLKKVDEYIGVEENLAKHFIFSLLCETLFVSWVPRSSTYLLKFKRT